MIFRKIHTPYGHAEQALKDDLKLSPEDRLEKARKINEALWPELFNEKNYNKTNYKLKWIPR